MAPQTRTQHLAARLLLLFAVLFCVLGLGQASAAAAETEPALPLSWSAAATTAQAPGEHAGHHAGAVKAAGSSADHRPTEPQPGHGGHGSGDQHALTCMVTSAAVALGVLAAPDATGLVPATMPAPPVRSRAASVAAAHPHPPSIAALCVQRI